MATKRPDLEARPQYQLVDFLWGHEGNRHARMVHARPSGEPPQRECAFHPRESKSTVGLIWHKTCNCIGLGLVGIWEVCFWRFGIRNFGFGLWANLHIQSLDLDHLGVGLLEIGICGKLVDTFNFKANQTQLARIQRHDICEHSRRLLPNFGLQCFRFRQTQHICNLAIRTH